MCYVIWEPYTLSFDISHPDLQSPICHLPISHLPSISHQSSISPPHILSLSCNITPPNCFTSSPPSPTRRRLYIPNSQLPSLHPTLLLPYNTMSDLISLFCLVHGDSFNRSFMVKIERQEPVAALKELIIIKGPRSLRDMRAPDLKL